MRNQSYHLNYISKCPTKEHLRQKQRRKKQLWRHHWVVIRRRIEKLRLIFVPRIWCLDSLFSSRCRRGTWGRMTAACKQIEIYPSLAQHCVFLESYSSWFTDYFLNKTYLRQIRVSLSFFHSRFPSLPDDPRSCWGSALRRRLLPQETELPPQEDQEGQDSGKWR